MIVGTPNMTLSVTGVTYSASYTGSTGLAGAIITQRGPLFVAALNASVAARGAATLSSSEVSAAHDGASQQAQDATALATAIVTYLQASAVATLPAASVDGVHPVSYIPLAVS